MIKMDETSMKTNKEKQIKSVEQIMMEFPRRSLRINMPKLEKNQISESTHDFLMKNVRKELDLKAKKKSEADRKEKNHYKAKKKIQNLQVSPSQLYELE